MKPLPSSFYLRPTLQVAKDLLGKFIVRKRRGIDLVGKIVEVEAYLGSRDPASHAYRGMTKRNEVMFQRGGCLYVYFTYGMHYCANVVTRKEGIGEAVLIRAVEPVQGVDVMMRNRLGRGGVAMRGGRGAGVQGKRQRSPLLPSSPLRGRRSAPLLTNGPAKFAQAFGLGRRENGIDLTGSEVFISNGEKVLPSLIGRSVRVGINVAKEKRWRFFVKENAWVSRKQVPS